MANEQSSDVLADNYSPLADEAPPSVSSVLSGVTPGAGPSVGAPTQDMPSVATTDDSAQPPRSAVNPPAPGGAWRTILEGVMTGLAGQQQRGRSGVGNAIVGAAKGFEQQKQQNFENDITTQRQNNLNAETKSNIQFQNLRAAQSIAETAKMVQDTKQGAEGHQLAMSQGQSQFQEYLRDNGLTSNYEFPDTSAAGHGALQTLATANGGTVPEVSATHAPGGPGKDGQLQVYAPTPSDDMATQAAQLGFINKARQVQGLPAISQMAIRKPADRAAAFHDAFEFFNPNPQVASDGVETRLNHVMQVRDAWQKAHPDDTSTVGLLNAQVKSLQTSQKNFNQADATKAAMKSGAEEQAKLNVKNADEASQAANISNITDKYGITPTDTPTQIAAKLPPGLSKTIQGMVNYEINPNTFPSRVAGNKKGGNSGQIDRQTALGLAKMLDSSYDDTQYRARADVRQDYYHGKTSFNIRAINTAVHHMDELNQSQAKLASFGFDSANYVKNKLTPGFLRASAQVPTESDINAVTSEVANVFKGASATDPELDSWKKGISINSTHAEFESWIQEGMKLMAGRADAIKGGWESTMQKPYNFDLIYPATRKALETMPGGDKLASSMGITKGGGAGNDLSPAALALVNKYKGK